MNTLAPVVLITAAHAQKTEFDAASIKVNPPRTGFHFTTDTGSGGPGTSDPGIFRCSECTLATLIARAFDLRDYQFPGKSSLGANTFEVMARIPAGATHEEFLAMMQNLLKDRFQLTWHFNDKRFKGYSLTVGRGGSKLKESLEGGRPAVAGESHAHTGLLNFGGLTRFRADHQTMADLTRLLGDQLGGPVDDRTGLTGKYDIDLSWAGNSDHSVTHGDGGFGGAEHGDHGSGAPQESGPGLLEAVQSQLGLKLIASEQTTAKIFVIDRVEKLPAAN